MKPHFLSLRLRRAGSERPEAGDPGNQTGLTAGPALKAHPLPPRPRKTTSERPGAGNPGSQPGPTSRAVLKAPFLSLRVRIILRVAFGLAIGLTLTFWPIPYIASGFLKPNFSPDRVREIKLFGKLGIAAVGAAYFGLAGFSVVKTVRAERRWFKDWQRVEEENRSFEWPEYMPSSGQECNDCLQRIPKHSAIFFRPENPAPFPLVCPPKLRTVPISEIFDALKARVVVGILAQLKQDGLPNLTIAASPSCSTLLIKATTINARNLTAYAIGVVEIGLIGKRFQIDTYGTTYSIGTKSGFATNDTWIGQDAAWLAKKWMPLAPLAMPLLCLLNVPMVIMSIWRRWPFTDGDLRNTLALETGLFGEHIAIVSQEDRPWSIVSADHGPLQNVLSALVQCLRDQATEAVKTLERAASSEPR